MLKENAKSPNPEKLEEFRSLTHMKKIIKTMIAKEKIKSAGYEKKLR